MNAQRHMAALMIGLATAGMACAATITPKQQEKVKIGTPMDEVRQLLGEPSRIQKVRHAPGPTWVYELHDGQRVKDYELDFHDGKVQWIEVHDYRD